MSARRIPRTRLFAAAFSGILAVAIACSVDSPTRGDDWRSAAAGPTRVSNDQVLFDFQVEQQVAPRPNSGGPRYPDMLRSANVEGEVLAQFVVDTTGRADMGTFTVLKSTHYLFTNAVKSALPNMRFHPAEVGGRKVKQLVEMPFQFSLHK